MQKTVKKRTKFNKNKKTIRNFGTKIGGAHGLYPRIAHKKNQTSACHSFFSRAPTDTQTRKHANTQCKILYRLLCPIQHKLLF